MLDVMIGRPAHRRHGHRRRPGVLLLPGQSDPRPRTLPRGARPDRQGVDDAGAVHRGTRSTTSSATSIPGRGRLQQPHPPIWIPGAGSLETIEFVAQRRYAYMGMPYFHIDVFRRVFDQFREACQKAGYTAKPEQMGWGVPIYVAETDRQAREEFEPHFWYFVEEPAQEHQPGAARLHVGALGAGDLKNRSYVPVGARRPGTTSRKASSPSSAARRRCGRSSTIIARSWASASC